MSSSREVVLTDLPLVVLARIAGEIPEGERCEVANLPYQKCFEAKDLFLLQPLRLCCKALRDAAYLAVGGLIVCDPEAENFRRTNLSDSNVVPVIDVNNELLKISLTLPALRELHVYQNSLRPEVAKVLEVIVGLNYLSLRGMPSYYEWNLREFPSSATIQHLKLDSVGDSLTDHLLSFRYDNLVTLSLDNITPVPSFSAEAVRTLRMFHMKNSFDHYGLGRMLKTLAKIPNLQTLALTNYIFNELESLQPDDRFEAVTDLVVDLVSIDCMEHFARLFANGCFPSIRVLGTTVGKALGGRECLQGLEPLLMTCGKRLHELHLAVGECLTEEDVSMLKRWESFGNFELHLAMDGGSYGGLKKLLDRPQVSMSRFASLSSLTHIIIYERTLCDIEKLCEAPKLKEVGFFLCRFRSEEVSELIEKVEKVVVCDCESTIRDGLWNKGNWSCSLHERFANSERPFLRLYYNLLTQLESRYI